MTEMIYEYDGSFEGFLTCIFESYAQKEVRTFHSRCSLCGPS